MARIAVAVIALVAAAAGVSGEAPAGTACHPIGPHVLARGSLDADRATETLAELEGPVDCAHSAFVARMMIQDRCRGRVRSFNVSAAYRRPDETIDVGRIVEADGLRGRREAFFVVHGATGDSGEAAVLHLVRPRAGACPRPRDLFRYRPAEGVVRFEVELLDLSTRSPGLEVRVSEIIDRDGLVKTYRFDRARGRYVEYGSR
jgi:hypothetical protein